MNSDRIAKGLFVASVLFLVWGYGAISYRLNLFPYPQIAAVTKVSIAAVSDLLERSAPDRAWWYQPAPEGVEKATLHLPERIAPGNLLVIGFKEDNKPYVRAMDNRGRTLHEWDVDWFRLWPDPTHLREVDIPKSDPGGHVQGAIVMANGDLVFNFERLGLLRINGCSEPVWRLPYRTHHSVHLDESGNIWVPGMVTRESRIADAPNHVPAFEDFRLLEVSPSGKLLTDISLFGLLSENGLQGLMYLSTINNWGTSVTGDTLHLNDLETFPSGLPEGVFQRGDVMVSLRNINAVLVFNKDTRKVKYLNVGSFIRQHDPDFIDGNHISVFDNNNLSAATEELPTQAKGIFSRIAVIDARTDAVRVAYSGSADRPFFTDIIGSHQWLPNGNLLITESRAGRAFEVGPDGALVWEFHNLVDKEFLGMVKEVSRLPPRFDEAFFAGLRRGCGGPGASAGNARGAP